MTISTKVCPMCRRRLPLDRFYSNKGRSDGVATYCKPCYRDKTNCNRAAKREKGRAMSPSNFKTEAELESMKHAELKAYAKEIGCCLGYEAGRKDTMRAAIIRYQRHIEGGNAPKGHPWRRAKGDA